MQSCKLVLQARPTSQRSASVMGNLIWGCIDPEKVVQVYGFCIHTSFNIRYKNVQLSYMYNEELCRTAALTGSRLCLCLYFKICAFQVIKNPHGCQDHCYHSRLCVRRLHKLVEASEDGQIQVPQENPGVASTGL